MVLIYYTKVNMKGFNMTRKEFVEKLFGEDFHCINDWCDSCEYNGFWNKEINSSDTLKTVLNILYGTQQTFVIGARDAGKTYAIERSLELHGWMKFPRLLDNQEFEHIRDIVADARDNGFEFKVYNSTLYYREKGYANTDSVQDVD